MGVLDPQSSQSMGVLDSSPVSRKSTFEDTHQIARAHHAAVRHARMHRLLTVPLESMRVLKLELCAIAIRLRLGASALTERAPRAYSRHSL